MKIRPVGVEFHADGRTYGWMGGLDGETNRWIQERERRDVINTVFHNFKN
jgi:hypothetical protein